MGGSGVLPRAAEEREYILTTDSCKELVGIDNMNYHGYYNIDEEANSRVTLGRGGQGKE